MTAGSFMNKSSRVVFPIPWNGKSLCVEIVIHAEQTQVLFGKSWIRLYPLGVTFAHSMWLGPLQQSQSKARWFLASVLEHTPHLGFAEGPGFRDTSPLIATRVSWNVEVEFVYRLILPTRYLTPCDSKRPTLRRRITEFNWLENSFCISVVSLELFHTFPP